MRRFSLTMAIALGCVPVWSADWLTAKDIKLLWKIKLDNEPRQMHNLFPPLIIERANTSRGPKQIANRLRKPVVAETIGSRGDYCVSRKKWAVQVDRGFEESSQY